jgi:hypothetical protein
MFVVVSHIPTRNDLHQPNSQTTSAWKAMPQNYFVLTGLLGPSVALNLTELTGDLAQRETVLGDRHCLKANITAICDEFELW